MKQNWQIINRLIQDGAYKRARKLILGELKKKPESHWNFFQLSNTYYEERDYKTAVRWSAKALHICPECPVAVWHHAGALQMLGRTKTAIAHYLKLAESDPRRLARDPCGESLSRARTLVGDSFYRLADCYMELRNQEYAIKCLEYYLGRRKKGWRSIYSLREGKKILEGWLSGRKRST